MVIDPIDGSIDVLFDLWKPWNNKDGKPLCYIHHRAISTSDQACGTLDQLQLASQIFY